MEQTGWKMSLLINLIGLGFKLGKVEINKFHPDHTPLIIYELPEGWKQKKSKSNTNYIIDKKERFRIRYSHPLTIFEYDQTVLFPRFQLLRGPSSSNELLVLLDEELRVSGNLRPIVAELPIISRFYKAHYPAVDAIIDAHLPNLRNPFDHWGQDRTRAIQNMQKELKILVQSTPEKIKSKKKIPSVEP
jgi:hypothetical protein